jgi:excisionase family DNA binding protein
MALMTTAEAAQRLEVSVERVLWYIWAGRLPARRFGRQWAIDEADLDRFERLPVGRPPQARSG